jgi:hypothetical protein
LVYPFTAAVVVFVRWCWRNSVRTRPLVVLSLAGMFVIQLGGVVYRIRRDPYHREYLPAADFLRARAQPGDLIMGSHELRFTIGFRDDFVDDRLLGLENREASRLYLRRGDLSRAVRYRASEESGTVRQVTGKVSPVSGDLQREELSGAGATAGIQSGRRQAAPYVVEGPDGTGAATTRSPDHVP